MAVSLEPYGQFLLGFQPSIALKMVNTIQLKTTFLFFFFKFRLIDHTTIATQILFSSFLFSIVTADIIRAR